MTATATLKEENVPQSAADVEEALEELRGAGVARRDAWGEEKGELLAAMGQVEGRWTSEGRAGAKPWKADRPTLEGAWAELQEGALGRERALLDALGRLSAAEEAEALRLAKERAEALESLHAMLPPLARRATVVAQAEDAATAAAGEVEGTLLPWVQAQRTRLQDDLAALDAPTGGGGGGGGGGAPGLVRRATSGVDSSARFGAAVDALDGFVGAEMPPRRGELHKLREAVHGAIATRQLQRYEGMRPPRPPRLNELLPSSPRAQFKLCVVEFVVPGAANGGSDKGPNGHRIDSIPIANGVIKAGGACDLVTYSHDAHQAFASRTADYDALIVRINPGQLSQGTPAGTQERFDGLMNEYIAQGKLIWSSPKVQTQMGAKDALVKINQLKCGLPDTLAYYSADELAAGFRKTCAYQPRVLKQNRGSAGEGIWLCWLWDKAKDEKIEIYPSASFGEKSLGDDDYLKLMEVREPHSSAPSARVRCEAKASGRAWRRRWWPLALSLAVTAVAGPERASRATPCGACASP